MHFILEYIVKEMDFIRDEFSFHLSNPTIVILSLRPLKEEEIKPNYKASDVLCTVSTEREPPAKLRRFFDETSKSPSVKLTQYADQLQSELTDYAIRTVRVMRWVYGSSGPHSPIRYLRSFRYSIDGLKWNLMPSSVHLDIRFGIPVLKNITDEIKETVAMLVDQGVTEPLGHELFLEAYEQRTENPRSALILGIAAVETGLKYSIGTLAPDAKWLIDNMQSPQVVKMLSEYLPTLPIRKKMRGCVIPPPPMLIKALAKGITIRNELVHGKSTKLSSKTLDEVLFAAHDILYLLDFYLGHEWAFNRITASTQQEIIKELDKFTG